MYVLDLKVMQTVAEFVYINKNIKNKKDIENFLLNSGLNSEQIKSFYQNLKTNKNVPFRVVDNLDRINLGIFYYITPSHGKGLMSLKVVQIIISITTLYIVYKIINFFLNIYININSI